MKEGFTFNLASLKFFGKVTLKHFGDGGKTEKSQIGRRFPYPWKNGLVLFSPSFSPKGSKFVCNKVLIARRFVECYFWRIDFHQKVANSWWTKSF